MKVSLYIEVSCKRIKAGKDANKALHMRLREFVKGITDGKIPMKDDTKTLEEIWKFLLKNNVSIYQSTIHGFLHNKAQYQCTDEELQQTESYFQGLSMQKQMLIYLWDSTNSLLETADWQGYYNDEKGSRLTEICEFFQKYGFTITEEEQEIIYGTSNLYQPKES